MTKPTARKANMRGPTLNALIEARQSLQNDARASSLRRAEIVALSAVLFSESGYRGTTIRDIAERADILSGSLYHHFESKESILDEIMRAYWIDLFDGYERVLQDDLDSATQICEMIAISVRMLQQHGPATRILLTDYSYVAAALPYIESLTSVIEWVWTDLLIEGARVGALRADLDPVLTYRNIMSAIAGTGRWFDPTGTITVQQVVTEMQQTFMRGISVHAG
jgi:AcrR family transcriptional regulator